MADCGTDAGYRAHRRAKQDACLDCKRAHRDVAQARRLAPAISAPVLSIVKAEPPGELDPLDDHRRNLAMVTAAMDEAPPPALAALSKRRQELVQLITASGGTKEVTLADQLAELRARRAGAPR